MTSFLKSAGIIFVLFIAALAFASSNPEAAWTAGLVVLLVAGFAVIKPLPKAHLGHRGFSLAVALLVGLPMFAAGSAHKNGISPRPAGDTAALQVAAEVDGVPIAAAAAAAPNLEVTTGATTEAPREAVQGLDDFDAAMSARSAAEQAEIDELIGQVDREIASIPTISAARYRESMERITAGVILIGAWGLLYEEASLLDLPDEQRKKLERFRAMAIQKQSEILPVMRDAYGPLLRRDLWEADGTARTTGNGYRTITITMPIFVRNANIKEAHQTMRDQLMMLRFTRAEYKWIDHGEYSYYTLTPSADRDLVRWEDGGRFRVLN